MTLAQSISLVKSIMPSLTQTPEELKVEDGENINDEDPIIA